VAINQEPPALNPEASRRNNFHIQIISIERGCLKLSVYEPKTTTAAKRRKTIARAERSEPLVGIFIEKSPEGAKDTDKEAFRPSGALFSLPLPGVRCAHPWLLSCAPSALDMPVAPDSEF
jgi:hypothetical protein